MDAMGCQTSIAQTTVDGGGDYLLPVKENQPTLSDEIQVCFAEADAGRLRARDVQPRPQLERFQEVDKGHGRLEIRTVEICRDLDWITTSNRWTGLTFVTRVVRERTVLTSDKTSTETAYYIGSAPRLQPKPLLTRFAGTGRSRTNFTGFSTSLFAKMKRVIGQKMLQRI